MERKVKHLDCRNYAPVDVAKGICHMNKQIVLADGERCQTFQKVPKCKHCKNYETGEEEYVGTCKASTTNPMTYPDLHGVTCEHFVWQDT